MIRAKNQWFPLFIAMMIWFYSLMFFLLRALETISLDLEKVVLAKNELRTLYFLPV
jgi:hypothetical protein